MTDIISLLKQNLINNTSLNRVRDNIIENTNAEDIEKAKLQINYQLICTALEKAIIETFVNYPNAESTNYLKEQVHQALAELQIITSTNGSMRD
tara:strand:- start:181 stop:462 length:282 start_codon:yes stop_codon:yes gene_type:complete